MCMTPSRKALYSKKWAELLMGLVTCSSTVFLILGKHKSTYFKLMKPVMIKMCHTDLFPAGQRLTPGHQMTSFQAGDLDLNERELLALWVSSVLPEFCHMLLPHCLFFISNFTLLLCITARESPNHSIFYPWKWWWSRWWLYQREKL